LTVAENLKNVRERIASAGRDPGEITIVAVTNTSAAIRSYLRPRKSA